MLEHRNRPIYTFSHFFLHQSLCIKIKKDPNYDFKEAGNATQKPYFFARQANIRLKQL